jgi:hypothetical protein
MLSDKALMESIFTAALTGCNVDVAARRDVLWDACICIMADSLRSADPFNRERKLRNVAAELRKSIATIDQLLKPRPKAAPHSPYDFTGIVPPEGTQ